MFDDIVFNDTKEVVFIDPTYLQYVTVNNLEAIPKILVGTGQMILDTLQEAIAFGYINSFMGNTEDRRVSQDIRALYEFAFHYQFQSKTVIKAIEMMQTENR